MLRTFDKVFLLCIAAAVAFTAVWPAQAQAPPAFAVATIKPSEAPGTGGLLNFPGPGRLSAPNFTLKTLIGFAFGQNLEISGGPSWMAQDRYNLQAQADGEPTNAERLVMLRSLLVERFALKYHMSSKEVDVYALVLAKSDGKLGPNIKPSAAEGPTGAMFRAPGIVLRRQTMSTLANMLSANILADLGRRVVDRTGLTGQFDVDLAYSRPNPQAKGGDPLASEGPSLFTVIQEQLGLKLESSKGTVEMLIVDQAERPTEN